MLENYGILYSVQKGYPYGSQKRSPGRWRRKSDKRSTTSLSASCEYLKNGIKKTAFDKPWERLIKEKREHKEHSRMEQRYEN